MFTNLLPFDRNTPFVWIFTTNTKEYTYNSVIDKFEAFIGVCTIITFEKNKMNNELNADAGNRSLKKKQLACTLKYDEITIMVIVTIC